MRGHRRHAGRAVAKLGIDLVPEQVFIQAQRGAGILISDRDVQQQVSILPDVIGRTLGGGRPAQSDRISVHIEGADAIDGMRAQAGGIDHERQRVVGGERQFGSSGVVGHQRQIHTTTWRRTDERCSGTHNQSRADHVITVSPGRKGFGPNPVTPAGGFCRWLVVM